MYFITNTNHCIIYLTLTQLFPVLVTSFAAFNLGVYHCVFNHRCVHMGQTDFDQSPYPDSQTVDTLRPACIFMCRLTMLSLSKGIIGQAV